MTRFGWLIASLGVATACQTERRPQPGDEPAAVAPVQPQAPAPPAEAPADPYRADIENLCDSMNRSGAEQLPQGDRQLAIAGWLGGHIQTAAAHQFLVHIQPLQGIAKADALVAEARKVGLADCALAAEWRGPGAVNPL